MHACTTKNNFANAKQQHTPGTGGTTAATGAGVAAGSTTGTGAGVSTTGTTGGGAVAGSTVTVGSAATCAVIALVGTIAMPPLPPATATGASVAAGAGPRGAVV